MDLVFRALADPTRRALLDELFTRDGQALVSLTARHDMTRIAVAKHLKILEDAGLIVSSNVRPHDGPRCVVTTRIQPAA